MIKLKLIKAKGYMAMSYDAEVDGSITFEDGTDMDAVCDVLWNSTALSYCYDKEMSGRSLTVDIGGGWASFHPDMVHNLLLALSSGFNIDRGRIEVHDECGDLWAYDYDSKSRKWRTKVMRIVDSASYVEENGAYICAACGHISKTKYNYCPNCGSFVNLTKEEEELIKQRTAE